MIGSVKSKAVHFDDRFLHVQLEDGRVISTPIGWYENLKSATIRENKNCIFTGRGAGIEWPDIDYHFGMESMLALHYERQVT
jgi:hypothetical protein